PTGANSQHGPSSDGAAGPAETTKSAHANRVRITAPLLSPARRSDDRADVGRQNHYSHYTRSKRHTPPVRSSQSLLSSRIPFSYNHNQSKPDVSVAGTLLEDLPCLAIAFFSPANRCRWATRTRWRTRSATPFSITASPPTQ